MAKGKNPYAGQYAPSKLGLGKEDLVKGLKGIKIPHPNRHLTTNEYKKNIGKTPEEK